MVALLVIIFPSLSQAAVARSPRPGGDIIGGGPADPGEYPFMTAILDVTIGGSDYNKQFCGGSLISADWVLTAAHCVQGEDPKNLAVAVGRTLLNSNQGVRSNITAVYVHPDYGDPTGNSHDAALLHLATGVPSQISPIRLADNTVQDNRFEDPGTMLTVIGWGTTSTHKASYPNDLREVDVPVVGDATCQGAYGASLDIATMVCAGAPNIDSCYGDSGGPLFARNGGDPVEIGIVSWGNGCAKKRFPGVYSEVNSQRIRDWILQTSGV